MDITNIKEIREGRDLKQSEIAELLDITQAQYSRYELGINNIPIEKLDKLANFYETSIDYLLGRTDEKKPYNKKKPKY